MNRAVLCFTAVAFRFSRSYDQGERAIPYPLLKRGPSGRSHHTTAPAGGHLIASKTHNFVDRGGPEFKRLEYDLQQRAVYTPDGQVDPDTNSTRRYSYVARTPGEPLVFRACGREGRYYSLQFIRHYTFNFAYVEPRHRQRPGTTCRGRSGRREAQRASNR